MLEPWRFAKRTQSHVAKWSFPRVEKKMTPFLQMVQTWCKPSMKFLGGENDHEMVGNWDGLWIRVITLQCKGLLFLQLDIKNITIYGNKNVNRLKKYIQWEFQDPKMEVLYRTRPYFVGIFPYILKNRPSIYGRYLQLLSVPEMAIDTLLNQALHSILLADIHPSTEPSPSLRDRPEIVTCHGCLNPPYLSNKIFKINV